MVAVVDLHQHALLGHAPAPEPVLLGAAAARTADAGLGQYASHRGTAQVDALTFPQQLSEVSVVCPRVPLLASFTKAAAPALVSVFGTGSDTAATLLITAGSNPERLHSEAAFAALCGVSPIPASSGKTNRHRLNRGGDRQANAALYRVVVVRLRHDARTREYMRRRTGEGMSKTEVIRCLKRYVAREVFTALRTADEKVARPV